MHDKIVPVPAEANISVSNSIVLSYKRQHDLLSPRDLLRMEYKGTGLYHFNLPICLNLSHEIPYGLVRPFPVIHSTRLAERQDRSVATPGVATRVTSRRVTPRHVTSRQSRPTGRVSLNDFTEWRRVTHWRV